MTLAHMFDRNFAYGCLLSGARIGFYSGDMNLLNDAMVALKPTVTIMVPRILMRLYNMMVPLLDTDPL